MSKVSLDALATSLVTLIDNHQGFEAVSPTSNGHPHLRVQAYCDTVQAGDSVFCDYVWGLWEVDFFQTTIICSLVFVITLFWGLVLGQNSNKKKSAFLAV
mmetsp:Transcript_2527/g.4245  ORF Transcript_2527/g.4245 Transcript_2527/m.4245 type:complete len:100 (-) Transcript_2527:68-367(-)